MKFECKVFDKYGKLKKIISATDIVNSVDKVLQKKSTQRAIQSISKFRQAKVKTKVDFRERICLFCEKKFHARQKSAKYCSQECQKRFYKKRRR
jgi:hypothetical protein